MHICAMSGKCIMSNTLDEFWRIEMRELSGEIYRQSQQEAITRLISKLWKGRDYKMNTPLEENQPCMLTDSIEQYLMIKLQIQRRYIIHQWMNQFLFDRLLVSWKEYRLQLDCHEQNAVAWMMATICSSFHFKDTYCLICCLKQFFDWRDDKQHELVSYRCRIKKELSQNRNAHEICCIPALDTKRNPIVVHWFHWPHFLLVFH
jgi:nitrate reductase cytochrome c-type subunit